jgi:NAD(P)-dependent dehydrogenase (short-subunit alcohol dehydrogenase family)
MTRFDLKNRGAIVTGGSSGIGHAAVCELARSGARVGVLARHGDELDEVVESLRSEGVEAHCEAADIAEWEQTRDAVDAMARRLGRLDILFANAGVNGVWAPIEKLEAEDFASTIDINLKGTFHTIKPAVAHMKERGGSIIVTSSINGTRIYSNTGATAYASSKAGQVAMTKMLALELAPFGIRVNVVCPGAIESRIEEKMETRDLGESGYPSQFPEGKVPLTGGEPGEAAEVGRLVAFLASDMSRHITGTEIYIDGAQSLLVG